MDKIMKRISSKTVAAQLVRDYDIDNPNRIINAVLEWSREALVYIGTKESFERKECVITVENYRAELPYDFYKLIDVKMGENYLEISNRSFRMTSKNDSDLADRTAGQSLDNKTSTPISNFNKFNIENGLIYTTAQSGTLGVSYYAFPFDDDGDITVDISQLEAVTAYCKYMFLESRTITGKVPYRIYKNAEQRWWSLCGKSRGDNVMPSRAEAERLGSIWNNLTPWKRIRSI
jgi:hypothetical protein